MMTPKQEAALRDYLQEAIVPLIEQVLVKKLGQAMSFAAEELIHPKPASKPWVGLDQQDIDIAFDDTQEGGGFNEFARAIEAKLREKNAQSSKPLTDENLRKLANKHLFYQPESYEVSGVFALARAIEAAHGIKGEA